MQRSLIELESSPIQLKSSLIEFESSIVKLILKWIREHPYSTRELCNWIGDLSNSIICPYRRRVSRNRELFNWIWELSNSITEHYCNKWIKALSHCTNLESSVIEFESFFLLNCISIRVISNSFKYKLNESSLIELNSSLFHFLPLFSVLPPLHLQPLHLPPPNLPLHLIVSAPPFSYL